jgi:hypothetical protein
MPWGYAAAAVVGAYGAHEQNKGAKDAAHAVSDAQQAQYQQTRQDLLPYMQAGQSALPLLQQLSNGDYSALYSSPDYQFALQSGINNLDKSAASRGSLFSGGHEKDLSQFNQGLASQQLNQFRGSLLNLANLGQNSAAQTGQFGANAATNSGNALAGMYQQTADNNSQFASGLGSLFARYMGSRGQQPGGSPSSYSMPSSGNYAGLGGQSMFSQQQPDFGNNYGSFGNFNWNV